MIKLSISPEIDLLRSEFKAWLSAHPPPKAQDSSLETFQRIGREWHRTLAASQWLGTHWPVAYGGRGKTLVEEAVIQEELARTGAPQILGLFGITMVGPVLISHGTDEQKTRFLSKILSGEEIWCQGFSEPGAGSDLASVKTRAMPVDGGYVVSGQKIWTSFAHCADWCFVLCRTSEAERKHEGLSYLLIPLSEQGVSVRPLRQISGDDEFNEVFFDSVFVPDANRIGNEGDGWSIAISTLMYERVILTFARQLQSEILLRTMLKRYDAVGNKEYAVRTAHCIVDACRTRAMAYAHLARYAQDEKPGPEGSMDKLLWSETFQELCKVGMSLEGAAVGLGEQHEIVGAVVHQYLYSRGRTIAAGTSEIQRSIIAERVLGLPRSA